jgi:hypothetical protein
VPVPVPVGAAGKIFVGYRMDTQLRKSSGTPGCDCASLAEMLLRNVCSVSRRDNTDRSLARSAWENVTQRSRPVGYGVISAVVRTDLKRREIPLGLAAPDHTVPYGTVLSRDAFPGTSCQATIEPSLRDISQQALAKQRRPNFLH